jgi:hypothetical protein
MMMIDDRPDQGIERGFWIPGRGVQEKPRLRWRGCTAYRPDGVGIGGAFVYDRPGLEDDLCGFAARSKGASYNPNQCGVIGGGLNPGKLREFN